MISEFTGRYSFLSNFYACQTFYNGIIFPTSEHAYQAAKTTDEVEIEKILKAATPDDAKKIGKSLTKRSDWDLIKDKIMFEIVESKFKNPGLADKLIRTENKVLIEGNYWHDNYWGACKCPQCRTIPHRNQLGKILMEIRKNKIRGN